MLPLLTCGLNNKRNCLLESVKDSDDKLRLQDLATWMTFSRVLPVCQEGEKGRGRQCREGQAGHT